LLRIAVGETSTVLGEGPTTSRLTASSL